MSFEQSEATTVVFISLRFNILFVYSGLLNFLSLLKTNFYKKKEDFIQIQSKFTRNITERLFSKKVEVCI
jgi:hypothetical protein